jgi:hypothetical protein
MNAVKSECYVQYGYDLFLFFEDENQPAVKLTAESLLIGQTEAHRWTWKAVPCALIKDVLKLTGDRLNCT